MFLKKYNLFLFLCSLILLVQSCSWFGEEKQTIPKNERIPVFNEKPTNQDSITKKEIIKIDTTLDLSLEKSNVSWHYLNGNTLNNLNNIFIESLNLELFNTLDTNKSYKISESLPNLIINEDILYYINNNKEIIGINYLNPNNKNNKIFKVNLSQYIKEIVGLSLANDNTLIISTKNGILIALSTTSGQIEWTLNLINPITSVALSDENATYVIANETLYSIDLYSGRINWKTIIAKPSLSVGYPSSPTLYDNYIIAGFSSGDLAILRKENGQIVWKSNIITNNLKKLNLISNDVIASPLIVNNKILFSSYGNITSLYDTQKQNEKIWEKSLGTKETPIFEQNRIYLIDTNSYLNSLNSENGEIIFSFNLMFLLNEEEKIQEKKQKFTTMFYGPLLVNSNLLITSSKGNLYFISPKDGTLSSQFKITLDKKEFIFQKPVIVNNNIFLLSNFGKIYILKSKS